MNGLLLAWWFGPAFATGPPAGPHDTVACGADPETSIASPSECVRVWWSARLDALSIGELTYAVSAHQIYEEWADAAGVDTLPITDRNWDDVELTPSQDRIDLEHCIVVPGDEPMGWDVRCKVPEPPPPPPPPRPPTLWPDGLEADCKPSIGYSGQTLRLRTSGICLVTIATHHAPFTGIQINGTSTLEAPKGSAMTVLADGSCLAVAADRGRFTANSPVKADGAIRSRCGRTDLSPIFSQRDEVASRLAKELQDRRSRR